MRLAAAAEHPCHGRCYHFRLIVTPLQAPGPVERDSDNKVNVRKKRRRFKFFAEQGGKIFTAGKISVILERLGDLAVARLRLIMKKSCSIGIRLIVFSIQQGIQPVGHRIALKGLEMGKGQVCETLQTYMLLVRKQARRANYALSRQDEVGHCRKRSFQVKSRQAQIHP